MSLLAKMKGGAPAPPSSSVAGALPAPLRQSSIKTYLKCPRQYWYTTVQGMRTPQGAAAAAGTAMHSVAEHFDRRRITQGAGVPTRGEVDEMAQNMTRDLLNTQEVKFTEKIPTRDDVMQRARMFSRAWVDLVAPHINPAEVELRFDTEIAGIPVQGTIDVVDVHGHIHDYKTTGRRPNRDEVLGSPQVDMYLGARAAQGFTNVGMSFRYLVWSGQTKTRPEPVVSAVDIAVVGDRAERAPAMAEELVHDVAGLIASGYFPRKTEGWHCSQKACDFYDRCMSGKDRP